MSDGPSLRARAFVALQHLLPQLWLSGVVGRIARTRAGWIRKPLIRAFMRGYRPEMADALQPNPLAYESFNAFFTRALRPGARPQPMEASAIVSPVDGSISALGSTRQGRIIQAKGRDYSLVELLAGNSELGQVLWRIVHDGLPGSF
jgi:phosphatidylserine decarboxylase